MNPNEKVEVLVKVITELKLSLPELDDLVQKIDSLFWKEANKQKEQIK